jgi:hypothetical protein
MIVISVSGAVFVTLVVLAALAYVHDAARAIGAKRKRAQRVEAMYDRPALDADGKTGSQ